MPLNSRFHEAHPMPARATLEQRLAWHLEHQKRCGCRPIPASLRALATPEQKPRCAWAGTDPLMIRYHDEEWGVPAHDDRRLFEMLVLEGAQAGLSWSTILKKRSGYRRAFAGFDPKKVAAFDARVVEQLLKDENIVRNRLKIQGAITSARAFLAVKAEHGSFDRFVWSFVAGKSVVNRPRSASSVPARTPESDALSKALAKRGFKFVGSTICYAFMQACGLVDDHARDCFRASGKKSSARKRGT
jgi:DNA-3-methyladenine glycosylase I